MNSVFLSLFVSHGFALLIPGATLILLLQYSTMKTFIPALLGHILAVSVFAFLSSMVVAYISQVPFMFTVLQIFGGVYMVYIGLQILNISIICTHTKQNGYQKNNIPQSNPFRTMFVSSIMNIQMGIFISSVMTPVAQEGITHSLIAMGIVVIQNILYFVLAWYLIHTFRGLIMIIARTLSIKNIAGIMLIIMGGRMIW